MKDSSLNIPHVDGKLRLNFFVERTLYQLNSYQKTIDSIDFSKVTDVLIDCMELEFLDSAASIFIFNLQKKLSLKNIHTDLLCNNQDILDI